MVVSKILYLLGLIIFNCNTVNAYVYPVEKIAGVSDDAPAIQDAINMASPGDTVLFLSGNYVINSEINFKSGVILEGKLDSKGIPISRITTVNSKYIEVYSSNLKNLTLRNLRFENLGFVFNNSDAVSIENCFFIDGINPNSTLASNTLQIDFINKSSNINVSNNIFWRRSSTQAGRVLRIHNSHNANIIKNRFIGFLKTAINISGYTPATIQQVEVRSRNIKIAENTLSRFQGNFDEDHGIYAWGIDGLEIINNLIQGWSQTSAGGSIKIYNGKNILIQSNMLRNSGILTYIYSLKNHEQIQYLENLNIIGNTIDLSYIFSNSHTFINDNPGIMYWWTNKGTVDPASAALATYEKNINIERNIILNGSIKILASRNPNEFLVSNNLASAYFLQAGVKSLGNK